MLLDCNGLDLDPGTFRQCSHLESAAGRAYTGKIGSIDFVHCAEICDVPEQDGGLDHIGQLIVCCSEDCLDIFQRLAGLAGDVVACKCAGCRINGQLTGNIDGCAGGGDALRVGTNGCGCCGVDT